MINFIVITHGEFGAYLVEAAESIVGRQEEGMKTISISSRVSVGEIRERIQRAIEGLRGKDGLVVMTDIPGGTPSNLAFPIVKDVPGVEMVTGMNLYMLISAFSHRKDLKLKDLVDKIMLDGQRSIGDVRKKFVVAKK